MNPSTETIKKYQKNIVLFAAFLMLLMFLLGLQMRSEAATTLSGNVQFAGNLSVTGALSKGSGSFAIDHPLDPTNKLLYHSFVESPDVKNIYDGVAELDGGGEVTIVLPEYFEVLNERFRYQFFPHEIAMPNLHIKRTVSGNSFTIAGGAPHGEISWQVTGIRHDPYILENPIVTEVEKGPEALLDKGEFIFEGYEEEDGADESTSVLQRIKSWFKK